MELQNIQKYIDRAVDTDGTLRIPSWWMHKILSDLVKYCEGMDNSEAINELRSYLASALEELGVKDSKLSEDIDALGSKVSELESRELFLIVDGLPEVGSDNKIYLVPSETGNGNNILTEWVYVNGSWEELGEFKAATYDDTDIQNKLTELSAEVSGLSERVDALGEGDSDIFKAIYDTTTYEEIKAAYDSGKVVHCDYQNICYVMSSVAVSHIFFSIINANNSNRIYVRRDSSWGQETTVLELTSNKTKTINESSTDTQYPSAKAVYDFVSNTLGTIINGDY